MFSNGVWAPKWRMLPGSPRGGQPPAPPSTSPLEASQVSAPKLHYPSGKRDSRAAAPTADQSPPAPAPRQMWERARQLEALPLNIKLMGCFGARGSHGLHRVGWCTVMDQVFDTPGVWRMRFSLKYLVEILGIRCLLRAPFSSQEALGHFQVQEHSVNFSVLFTAKETPL